MEKLFQLEQLIKLLITELNNKFMKQAWIDHKNVYEELKKMKKSGRNSRFFIFFSNSSYTFYFDNYILL